MPAAYTLYNNKLFVSIFSPHPPNINGGSSTPGTADEIKRETGVEPLPNGDAPGIQVDDKTSAPSESVKHNGHLSGANVALNHTGAAPGLNGPPQIRPGPGNLWLQNQKDLDLSRLKRPALPTTNYGDDKENEMKTLYDTQSLSRWYVVDLDIDSMAIIAIDIYQ